VTDLATEALPSAALYDAVPGQERAVEQLRRSAAHPVHAYLFAGPPGSGKLEAALGFAASLLCPHGGDGTCRDCRQALAGSHADLLVVERTGAYIRRPEAEEIIRIAARTPVEGRRKVLVLVDFHLVQEVAPMLLKTIEEPPPSTVFVILADHVPAELVTIASRCVRCDFQPLDSGTIRARLEAEGAAPEAAAEAARAAGGRIDRARLLVGDPDIAHRRALWEGVPSRLDGTGAVAAVTAAELLASIDGAKVFDALRQRQAEEVAALEERAELTGERVARKELEDRHKREQRRLRTDELRWGLAAMAGAYRDRAVGAASARAVAAATAAVAAIHAAAEALIRNPNETLLLQSLLIGLQPPG
jgi:DNA polymerase III subunit delta'